VPRGEVLARTDLDLVEQVLAGDGIGEARQP
jgi:hypothetical protein